jgi:thiol:disulfide interchange protein DsbD
MRVTLIAAMVCSLAIGAVVSAQNTLNPGTWSGRVEPSQLKPGSTANLLLTIKLDEGWHVYALNQPRPPIALRIVLEPGAIFTQAGDPQQPKPKVAFDPQFQIDTTFFEGVATFTLPIKVAPDAPAGVHKAVAKVTFQLCDPERCIPPRTRPVEGEVTILAAGASPMAVLAKPATTSTPSTSATPKALSTASPGATTSTSPSVSTSPEPAGATASSVTPPTTPSDPATSAASPTASQLRSRNLLSYIWLALGFGFVALLTPCVFPMIPITVSFFTKRENQSTFDSVKQALVYCFGIIFTFTGLGLLLTLISGPAGINRLAASPWMNLFLTTLFVVFALNLFGLFEIRLPSSWLSKLDSKSRGGSSLAGTLLMGLTFTLTSFTCTAAFVGAVLVGAT